MNYLGQMCLSHDQDRLIICYIGETIYYYKGNKDDTLLAGYVFPTIHLPALVNSILNLYLFTFQHNDYNYN